MAQLRMPGSSAVSLMPRSLSCFLLFSTKCTVERDRLDTAPDAVISVIDLREAVSRQEYLTNDAEL